MNENEEGMDKNNENISILQDSFSLSDDLLILEDPFSTPTSSRFSNKNSDININNIINKLTESEQKQVDYIALNHNI